MRDVLIHDYIGVDLAANDLPRLRETLTRFLTAA
jgi:uncharacterized protein with HEPN domain